MADADGLKAAPESGLNAAEMMKPLVAIAESGTATLVYGSREMVDRAIDHVQAVLADLDACVDSLAAEHDPIGIARCYSHFLVELGTQYASGMAEMNELFIRTGAGLLAPQLDGSRTETRFELEPEPAA